MQIKRFIFVVAVVILSTLVITSCSRSESESVDDHTDADEHSEAPHEYEKLTNPFTGDHEAVETGAEIYETSCAVCHGPEGKGDGPGAAGLDPQPADLSDEHMMEEMSDGALFWRVSEGGMMEPFNSAMPAWKDSLSTDEIWMVITYIQEFVEEDHD